MTSHQLCSVFFVLTYQLQATRGAIPHFTLENKLRDFLEQKRPNYFNVNDDRKHVEICFKNRRRRRVGAIYTSKRENECNLP